ncbi:hypothetical protein ASU33_11300 [Solirubrum puertoriconensis]|uniref:Uncharacterized protein n=1 Tax=Solirubrum puertoriconensis TaxID=1751427 RepID=A0A9X0L5H0_SOLP1|nr:hypothetical protein ASU33_11300 [Solirubrum puertoriconensis]
MPWLAGCGGPDVKVPQYIVTNATAKHKRIPGTHVYLALPQGYQPQLQQHMLWKSEREFVQVVELPDSSFADYVANIKQELSKAEGLSLQDLQQTTFNGLPAIFLKQPYRGGLGLESVLLAYGDSSHVTLVLGVYSRLDGKARERVQQALLTAYANPQVPVSPFEDLGFKVNQLDTNYQLLARDGIWAVYSPKGQPLADSYAPLFRVALLPPMPNQTAVQDAGLALIRVYRQEADVQNVQEANTEMNGFFAYENVLTYGYGGREGKALVLLISTPQGLLAFDGRAYADPYDRLKEFVRIAKAIRITAQPSV